MPQGHEPLWQNQARSWRSGCPHCGHRPCNAAPTKRCRRRRNSACSSPATGASRRRAEATAAATARGGPWRRRLRAPRRRCTAPTTSPAGAGTGSTPSWMRRGDRRGAAAAPRPRLSRRPVAVDAAAYAVLARDQGVVARAVVAPTRSSPTAVEDDRIAREHGVCATRPGPADRSIPYARGVKLRVGARAPSARARGLKPGGPDEVASEVEVVVAVKAANGAGTPPAVSTAASSGA